MVPRTEMVYIERHKTLRQAVSLGLLSGFSRIPVVGAGPDDVVGVFYLKDVVQRVFEHRDAESVEHIETRMRPATFVPDSKLVDDLLRELQAQRVHMAIVIDEYGGTAGLVTIEDILEEIVGEITDEYDQQAPESQPLPGGGFRLSARLHVEAAGELLGFDIDSEQEGVDTVGGLIAKRLGKVPLPGATITIDGWRLTAEHTTGRRNRISSVLAEQVDDTPDDVGNTGAAPASRGQTTRNSRESGR
jgi:CBS domain containing-hemolysin-like protein